MTDIELLRPRDGDALRAELRRVSTVSGVPVVFGGEVTGEILHLSQFFGTRTRGLEGLTIHSRSGLGGRVVEQRTPAAVSDYSSSLSITHHYDRPVLGEGLRSILAVPVVVSGVSRAVMYAAVRERGPLGTRIADAVISASRRLAREMEIRDEVDHRLRLLGSRSDLPSDPAGIEELRDAVDELTGIARLASDPGLRSALEALSGRMARALRPVTGDARPELGLTARELDVLAQIALGCTNAEAAERLSLGSETVKSYLRSAMRKTSTRTRHEAVVLVRRHGLLP